MPIIQTVTIDGGWVATLEILRVSHGQGAGFVLSSLARIIWTATVDVIGIFRVEGVFETLGLIQIELLCRLVGGSIQSVHIQNLDQERIHINEK